MASKSQESIIIGPKPTKACDPGSVLGRLEVIEALLGIRTSSKAAHSSPGSQTDAGPSGALSLEDDEDPEFSGLRPAVSQLRCLARQPQNDRIWAPSVMKQLWTSFHDNVPGLHFLSKKQTFSSPTPLLLASVLYVSGLHHPVPDVASLAPDYFVLTCSAISDLSVPSPRQNEPFNDENLSDEQRGFQDVLGLILAGLVSEAYIKETGIWISIGYRILLDYCPMNIDERSREWCGLFRGLQIIDLEHASLYMSCPILPRKAPLASLLQLQTSGGDPYDHLTQMMHIGMEDGTGESDDLRLIQSHLLTLKHTSQPPPSLRHQLAARLETDLQRLRTPPTSPSSNNPNASSLASAANNPGETNPWALFNQDSIRLDSPSWQFAPKQNYFAGPMSVDGQQQQPIPVGPMAIHGAPSTVLAQAGANGSAGGPEQWPPALMRLFGGGGEFEIDPESGEPVSDVM
ncbi:hypothetical protein SLS55_005530 [Diplodia seriata]|uniref:Transcription factor domain-containing protein n=1 Tax=Diplodia seriata TaxID=420778 RepID=A0ABR3CGN5_9PEZI